MKNKRSFRVRLCDFSGTAAILLTLIAFSFLTLVSLVQTCHVDIGFSPDNSEHVSFLWDSIPLNLLVLAALLMVTYLLLQLKISRRAVRAALAGVLLVSSAVGVWWILASKALPAADSKQIVDSARSLLAGNTAAVAESTYFRKFPFQLGYLWFSEAVLRLFGGETDLPLAFANVISVEAAYLAVYFLAGRLFRDERISLLTVLYMGLCMQPVFLTTFLYGTLPGLALALWATYFVVAGIQRGTWALLIPAAVLMCLAVVLKKNYAIVLIANVIVLLLHALRSKKASLLCGAALMAALSFAAPACVQKGYETRLSADFGRGTPQTAWLVTGFTESSFCCGWFNSYTTTVLMDNGFDYDKTLSQNMEDLSAQLTMFASRPRYFASFMYQKITSQWNEPAYQCIWSSASGKRAGEVSPFVESLGVGRAGDGLNACFNHLMQYIYAGFTLSLFLLLNRKKGRLSDERLILPLVVLGAAIYHALFEAKSQYALIYVPMLLPYAAYAMTTLLGGKAARRKG